MGATITETVVTVMATGAEAFAVPGPEAFMEEPEVESLWIATTEATTYDPLPGDTHVEVAVVGGGITGLTTAIELVESGYSVGVIEADRIATGTTGHTTAKLTSQHGLIYTHLAETFGIDRAHQYARANEAAIEAVATRVEELDVEAGFDRTSNYVYAPEGGDLHRLQREAQVANRLDLPATLHEDIPAPIPAVGALEFSDQAQFHPREYLLALARDIEEKGGRIFEQTRATGLSTGTPKRVKTKRGTVSADRVVMASLFPFADRGGYFARMHPSRAYLLAAEIEGSLPTGMFLSTESPPATFRPYRDDNRELLIVGGQSHKTEGSAVPTSERYRRIERFARAHFDVRAIRCRWSAHDFVPVDRVPFIGELGRLASDTYVGTGFAKWGMSGGTAAGSIIADLIVEGESPWSEIFDPGRLTASSLPQFLDANTTVAGRWMGDRVSALQTSAKSRDALPDAGAGAVLRHRGRPVAVHREEDGTLHAHSAVCPHLWCIVTWNDAERTWDCPCHGSRFDADGSVAYGPATERLRERDIQ